MKEKEEKEVEDERHSERNRENEGGGKVRGYILGLHPDCP